MKVTNSVLKTTALIFLLMYFSIGMSNEYIGERMLNFGNEWYPVFSWDLFSFIPNERTEYRMRIISYGSERYDPPQNFRETGEIFRQVGASPTEYTPIVANLGSAIESSHREGVETYRARLERVFGSTLVNYEIVKIVFDPVEFYQSSSVKTEEILGVYANF